MVAQFNMISDSSVLWLNWDSATDHSTEYRSKDIERVSVSDMCFHNRCIERRPRSSRRFGRISVVEHFQQTKAKEIAALRLQSTSSGGLLKISEANFTIFEGQYSRLVWLCIYQCCL